MQGLVSVAVPPAFHSTSEYSLRSCLLEWGLSRPSILSFIADGCNGMTETIGEADPNSWMGREDDWPYRLSSDFDVDLDSSQCSSPSTLSDWQSLDFSHPLSPPTSPRPWKEEVEGWHSSPLVGDLPPSPCPLHLPDLALHASSTIGQGHGEPVLPHSTTSGRGLGTVEVESGEVGSMGLSGGCGVWEVGSGGIYTGAARAARIARWREKKARLHWGKKVRYTCRQHFAEGRPRERGRFLKLTPGKAEAHRSR